MDIWIYWDDKPNQQTPDYIRLCRESIEKTCGNDFQINLITTENVKQFLPQIWDGFFQITQINNKSNYLRYKLLHEYGGIWLDSDLILLKSIKPLLDYLTEDIDLIATASPEYSYGQPESGFLISKPRGKVITKALELIERNFNSKPPGHVFQWGSMGPAIIRQAVRGLKYHHLNSNLLMPIGWQQAHRFLTNELIKMTYNKNIYGYMLYNEMFRRIKPEIFSIPKDQLLSAKTLLGQILRKALE